MGLADILLQIEKDKEQRLRQQDLYSPLGAGLIKQELPEFVTDPFAQAIVKLGNSLIGGGMAGYGEGKVQNKVADFRKNLRDTIEGSKSYDEIIQKAQGNPELALLSQALKGAIVDREFGYETEKNSPTFQAQRDEFNRNLQLNQDQLNETKRNNDALRQQARDALDVQRDRIKALTLQNEAKIDRAMQAQAIQAKNTLNENINKDDTYKVFTRNINTVNKLMETLNAVKTNANPEELEYFVPTLVTLYKQILEDAQSPVSVNEVANLLNQVDTNFNSLKKNLLSITGNNDEKILSIGRKDAEKIFKDIELVANSVYSVAGRGQKDIVDKNFERTSQIYGINLKNTPLYPTYLGANSNLFKTENIGKNLREEKNNEIINVTKNQGIIPTETPIVKETPIIVNGGANFQGSPFGNNNPIAQALATPTPKRNVENIINQSLRLFNK